MRLNIISRGSGAVAVASDTRGPWFESSHQQDFIMNINAVNFIEKTKIKKQRPGMAQFFNISSRRDVNKMILQKMYKGSFTISSKNWVQFQLEQKWWCGKHERERRKIYYHLKKVPSLTFVPILNDDDAILSS